jgi:hypothetical protein
LKDAKIVMLSRRQKRAYEIFGTLAAPDGWQDAGGDVDCAGVDEGDDGGFDEAPKSRANLASLYTQIPMFTAVVARNLAVPANTVEKGWLRRVDETVSMAFAVK